MHSDDKVTEDVSRSAALGTLLRQIHQTGGVANALSHGPLMMHGSVSAKKINVLVSEPMKNNPQYSQR